MNIEYTRVTEPLFILSGLTKVDPTVLQNAAERGTKVHELADALINHLGVFDLDEKIIGYMDSFKQWYIDKDFITKPERFYCDEHMLTGECDAIYNSPDGLVLVDFKTPLNESKTWRYQLSAYAYLARKQGLDIRHVEAVKLDKLGHFPKVYRYEEDWQTYLNCLKIFKIFFKSGKVESAYDYM